MDNFYKRSLALLVMLLVTTIIFAQTTVSGTVKDESGSPIPGVNIKIKGLVAGTTTNADGTFTLRTNQSPPFTIEISFIGYKSIETAITDSNTTGLEYELEPDVTQLMEVVIEGSGIMGVGKITAPQDVVKLNIKDLQFSPTAEVFDVIQHQPGVTFTQGSLNFSQLNTRGFATIANVRFVQMVDGMDISAPLLNFPTGNIVGIGELDLESMELLPGTSSGIYGPNAFNGLLLMNSKSPFEYEGVSAQFKGGITTSDAQGESFPLFNYGIRYAKNFNDKFAFKVNFNILQGEDWYGTDYRTDVNRPESPYYLGSSSNFDGLNLYGDDTRILLPLGPPYGTLDLRRTGWKEGDLLDDKGVQSIKGDIALHYRINDKLEAIYNYRYGGGSSVYQGSQKYALRDFTQEFHKLELRSNNFFVRAYMTATDAGDSYNLGALGGTMNEIIFPSVIRDGSGNIIGGWVPTYAQSYVVAYQGAVPSVQPGDEAAAHAYARQVADYGVSGRVRPAEGSAEFKTLVNQVRNDYFQRSPPGAKFIDNSKLYHAQFNYKLDSLIRFAQVMVGGNFRQYSLFSDGTIFNEDPENGTDFQRININEYGLFTQISKSVGDNLILTGSIRYDKNENFEGQITPRAAAVVSFGDLQDKNSNTRTHNLRASFQTGFRNPDTQAQFIYFPVGTNTLIGSTEANAERYGIFNGGSWTRASYEAGSPVTANIDYVQPEKLTSFEVGYRGVYGPSFFVEVTGYFNSYTDFIGSLDVVSKNDTEHHGNTIPAGTVFSPYINVDEKVNSSGVGLNFTYQPFDNKGYVLTGSYNYATFSTDAVDYRTGFNTPENKYAVGLANREVVKNFGFNINYRWQDEFIWQSDFGEWTVPSFGVLDAQVSYKLPSLRTVVKVGGQNLGGGDYRTNFGGSFVGQQYYISLTFDELLYKN